MFTVGQFAQLARVSIRTLHHYDNVGLLKPAAVDKATGYRFYEAAQLKDLNRILALKELGLTLHEITEIVAVGISGEELLGMLRLRQAEAERKADMERERLDRVEAQIRLLTSRGAPQDVDAVIVKPLDGARLAAVVEVIDDYDDADFGVLLPQLFERLYDETIRIGIRPPIGPIQAHFPRRQDGRIDVIAGVPIHSDEPIESEIVVALEIPPAERAATIVHQGHFAEASSAVQVLTEWLEISDQQGAFHHYREVYLQPEGPPETWIAEYQFVLSDPDENP